MCVCECVCVRACVRVCVCVVYVCMRVHLSCFTATLAPGNSGNVNVRQIYDFSLALLDSDFLPILR